MVELVRGFRASPRLLVTAVVTLAAATGMNAAMAGLVARAFLTPARHVADPAPSRRSDSSTRPIEG